MRFSCLYKRYAMNFKQLERTEHRFHGGPQGGAIHSVSVMLEPHEIVRFRVEDKFAEYELTGFEKRLVDGKPQVVCHYGYLQTSARPDAHVKAYLSSTK